ncbi:glutathione S-transferase U17-like [Papaver somniferum]|uniref:glutathione S-transferase U17-like n=1 Tax=Papaver somniferum TaxID=3469 RepID=UPI000E70306F|nr:glutathione S-transferase U17-like [Papaver somniferum]
MAGSESEEVKILGGWPAWPSPFVMRARVALNIKSVKYEFLEQPYGTKSELLLKSNPIYKKVPVMIHGDKPICESMNIVQYIDDVWSNSGHSIMPSDPYDASIARFWATYIDDKFFPSMSGITKCKDGEEYTAVIEQMIAAFGLLEQAYQEISKGKDFFGGEKIGYIDIAFGCYIGSIKVTEKMNGIKLHHETKAPGLTKWADKFCADDRVKPVDFITRRFTAGNRSSHGVC